MQLAVHPVEGLSHYYHIGDDPAKFPYKTWYWQPHTGHLIIKKHCHPGCREEINKLNIRSVEIDTNSHMKYDDLPGYDRKPIVCEPCKHACPDETT